MPSTPSSPRLSRSIAACLVLVAGLACQESPASLPAAVGAGPGDWRLGSDAPPPLVPPGPGAGRWKSERPTFENRVLAETLATFLQTPAAKRTWGVEAAGTFGHYFDNTGADYPLDPTSLLIAVPRLEALYQRYRDAVRDLASSLPAGRHSFASATAATDLVTKEEDNNWYLAVNAFSHYVTGQIAVETDGAITIDWRWHLWDRYDWDPGVIVPVDTPLGRIDVDQERVGAFHRQGLAREFDSIGFITAHETP